MLETALSGLFICLGWQVTLSDPIWQETPRSSEMVSHEELYSALTFYSAFYLKRNKYVEGVGM